MYFEKLMSVKFDLKNVTMWGEKFHEPSKIPTIKEKLHQHVKHINYKAFVWKNTLEAKHGIPEADQHGWNVIDKIIKVIGWTTKLPLRIF